jgi:hypothetical protein
VRAGSAHERQSSCPTNRREATLGRHAALRAAVRMLDFCIESAIFSTGF